MVDKVRYYLEQSVPELEDLKTKGLFDKNEITMIMRRRTEFEYRIVGRGSTPKDFLRYSEFEQNLEKLRKKRYNRLSKVGLIETKPSISDWAGVRRIMFILDRATQRFPGDDELWAQYLKFAKANGAIKAVYKIYSKLLQLQPRNIDAWLSSTKYEFETNGNAKGARLLFQRALRLNPESLTLWLNYAQFELTYVSKLLARRKVLGLLTESQQKADEEKENEKEREKDTDDMIALTDDERLSIPEMNMLGNPDTNPALKGDVMLAIFDVCVPTVVKYFNHPQDKAFEIAEKMLKIIDKFEDLNRDYLYQHILHYLQREYPEDLRTALIDITLPIRNVTSTSNELATLLQLSVNKFIKYKNTLKDDALTNMYTNQLSNQFLDNKSAKVDGLLKAIIKKCRTY
ncbi:UTP6 [Candida oxycetoniae]|uniref:UTP6 n=1 Tax=Candida oxycetoniae TaxID=497107 RepID=A0AAI9T0U7_9ASCO|nr:UTP6 [Candida oxycetoniae]KAI3406786.2 UTP6 [Candida oxycetoniae]